MNDGKAMVGDARTLAAAARGEPLSRAGVSLNLLLGFAPFIAFSVLMGLSVDLALWAAFAAAFTLGLPSFLKTRVLKTFDAGCVVLFGVLAFVVGFFMPEMVPGAVRLCVDAGLSVIALFSLIMGRPFTLQYARDVVEPERAAQTRFVRMHGWISAVWTAAFAIMAAADAAALTVPAVSMTVSTVLGLVAAAAALTFTLRYPAYASRRAARVRA